MCAGREYWKGSCSGDSGEGLLVRETACGVDSVVFFVTLGLIMWLCDSSFQVEG